MAGPHPAQPRMPDSEDEKKDDRGLLDSEAEQAGIAAAASQTKFT